MMELDRTLEAVGLTQELRSLLVQWDAELVRLRSQPSAGEDGRVEVSESDG